MPLIAGVAGGVWWRWGRTVETVSFRTSEIVRDDVRQVVTATGTLQAEQTVEVGTQVSGIVSELGADFNTELLRLESGVTWSFAVPATPRLELAGPTEAVRAALSARPALAAYVRSVDAVEAQVSAARAGGLPSVGLTVGAGTSWSTSRPAAFDAQLADQAAAWATVDLNVPILDRGVTRAAVERARLSVRQAVLASESARESVEVATRGAWAEREAAIEAAAAATLRRDAGAAAEAIVRERYEAGAVTFSELLVARAALADADERAITARADVDRASWTLAWVVGGL